MSLKGSYDEFFLSLWSVTSCLCIDKIPEVAKTKVSKPKRYSLEKFRFNHAHLKRLIQTRPHMSTSRCGEICKTPPKCICKERGRDFYSRSSIVAAAGVMSWRCCFIVKAKLLCLGFQKRTQLEVSG